MAAAIEVPSSITGIIGWQAAHSGYCNFDQGMLLLLLLLVVGGGGCFDLKMWTLDTK
jgi:hypothetical protein